VITGAGISVSCGIPDFRSKDTGLYNTLNCEEFGIPSAELLFDLDFFLIDPAPFYKFAANLLPKRRPIPSLSHRFIGMLSRRKKLLFNFSQNVDGIEQDVGVDPKVARNSHESV
jgi:NAD-dependent SIR2 family protein deacetylase